MRSDDGPLDAFNDPVAITEIFSIGTHVLLVKPLWLYCWTMTRRYSAIALSLLASACAANEDGNSKTPSAPATTPPAVAEVAAPTVDAAAAAPHAMPSIASVQLVQDCPDPVPAAGAAPHADPPKPMPPAQGKAKRKRDSASGSFVQPCTQSTVQLAFTGQGASESVVALAGVRLLSADDTPLATLTPRMPTIWQPEGGYVAWDGVLSTEPDQKVSYKLSVPDWAKVEATLGGSSYGQMYVLEIDVKLDGTTTTVRSSQFERARPQIIKT